MPEVDVQCPKKLHELHNDLPSLSERMEHGRVEKLVTNLNDKNEYVVHIRSLKQALNQGLILKNVSRFIKFNQKAWLEPYIKVDKDLRIIAKMILKKVFLSWWIT